VIKIKKIVFFILIILVLPIKVNAEIKDGLFATVGNKAITKSDIVDEIKIILILNNQSYSDDKREQLQSAAVKSVVKRSIKKSEIEKYSLLEFSKNDLNNELKRIAYNLNLDLETLKNIFASNGLDFFLIEDQITTELLWNSLIFQLYKDRLRINKDEIDDQLKLIQTKKEFKEFLISEIVVKVESADKLNQQIENLRNKIEIDGFEKTANSLSISKTAIKDGDLGWVNENAISKKFKSKIINTPINELSDPILLDENLLIFKVRDIRITKKDLSLEEAKNELVNLEKTKILNMYSNSHYDQLRRNIQINFLQ